MGFRLFYRSFGKPLKGTVLVLHGGHRGFSHDYLLPLADLTQFGYRVVLFDQLGCGRSDRPKAEKYYTEKREVEEVEAVRRALRLGKVHLVGHSYGGALALDVALSHQHNLRSLIVSGGLASHEHWMAETEKLWSRLPQWARVAAAKYGAKGDFHNPRFQAACDVFNRKHGCRMDVWPYELMVSGIGRYRYESEDPQGATVDRLKGWDVSKRLPEIELPTLITVGKYDGAPISCSQKIRKGIRGSRLVVFKQGSHLPMWEDRVQYIELVRDFLDGLDAR